ncbi:zinc permease [Solihabitans fulvus]|uniref:Zinc permease n=1 Tax=Solihabitans fulvus TaxID=1892852 RepID=A0A5B2WH25_9PSEU|nr:ZIP family metal transporter [Solihabitans fulvus]KAA2250168.1 zinc permease [Solihabitans fulvus]
MSSTNIAILGAVAGFTIFLGLPIGRLRRPALGLRAFLNASATGVLLFLLWDVLTHAVEPVTKALTSAKGGQGGWGEFAGLATVFALGLAIGVLSLVYYEQWTKRRATRAGGPGTTTAADLTGHPNDPAVAARRLSMLIAVGIGLHNFSEGLAIGQSAVKGEISLAVLLIVGFALHNATEGFGIVAPLAATSVRPSWGFLALTGLIGGGPTLLGTLLGQSVDNDWLYLAFLALAAGSILYVVVQLLGVGAKLGRPRLLYWGLLAGLFAGFATDFVLTAAGS